MRKAIRKRVRGGKKRRKRIIGNVGNPAAETGESETDKVPHWIIGSQSVSDRSTGSSYFTVEHSAGSSRQPALHYKGIAYGGKEKR